MNRRLIAYVHGREDPAARFRIAQYVPSLQQAGWQVSIRPRRPAQPWITPWSNRLLQSAHRRAATLLRRANRLRDIAAASRFDVVFLNRDLLEGKWVYEERLFRRNPNVVFDFDDAIYLGDKSRHIARICERAAWVITGNATLAAFAERFTARVCVIPTVVDSQRYRCNLHRTHPVSAPVRVGWLGSSQSIEQTLYPHIAMLAELQRELHFDFVIISKPRPDPPASSLRWRHVEWSPQVETEIADHFDIGIMPLVDDPFQRGKCGCKLLQYMAAGLASVASPIGINQALLGAGERGLAASSAREWRMALATLLQDAAARRRMGEAGRVFVGNHYSVERWSPELLNVIEKVLHQSQSDGEET